MQNFPETFIFEGGLMAAGEQVGNAVPPYLALQLAEVVASVIQTLDAIYEPDSRQVRAASVPAAPAP